MRGAIPCGRPVPPGLTQWLSSFAGSADYTSAEHAPASFTISQATPTVSVSDSGGTFNGSAYTATATVAGVVPGVDDTPAPSLEGVTPTLTYYDAWGNPLAGAPSAAGTYSVVASFAGSTDYTSATVASFLHHQPGHADCLGQ